MASSRRLSKTGLIALLCACVVHWGAGGLQTVQSIREVTAKDAAISAPKTIAICPHHPQGCPKECLCPKTHIHVGGDEDASRSGQATLNEPAWVTCSEQGPHSLTPSFGLFLPEGALVRFSFEGAGVASNPRKVLFQNPLQDPPQKIPIA